MATAIIETPNNPTYQGLTLGVQFNGGRAVIQSDIQKPSRYGYKFDELVQKFRTDVDGYTVTIIDPPAVLPAAGQAAPAGGLKPKLKE